MIDTALSLPAPDIEALLQGRMIAALPRIFINPGRSFALYPALASINTMPQEHYYHSSFLPIAQNVFAQLNHDVTVIKAWAKCELCQIFNDSESLERLSRLTIWTSKVLQQTLQQRKYIFLAYLRVYLLPQVVEIPVNTHGEFIALPHSLNVSNSSPVLSDRIFAQRRDQLEHLQLPLHPEIEGLHNALTPLVATNLAAKELAQEIKIFLGLSEPTPIAKIDADLDWISKITKIGNSSDGQYFEKLVRRSLIKLGFKNSRNIPEGSLDPNSTGGAGGLDFYADSPYPIVGECKATKTETVTDGTPAQLVKLGYKHLQTQYDCCIKIILAAGDLNKHANQTAIGNKMNVIRPETLQKLVELKAKYSGSINLVELKPCLEEAPFGEDADTKVNNFVSKVWQVIKMRSHIIKVIKNYLENAKLESAGVDAFHAVYTISSPPQPLTHQDLHEILIELSSPLTGYLGRIKGSDWKNDRFYFLRELIVDGD